MAAVARALDAPIDWAENQSASAAQVNRWGVPLWPADEPVAKPDRANRDSAPLDIWMLALVYGGKRGD